MKPMLDRMIDMIVAGLSGSARNFYDTEFIFFDAVTSISGKLRPYIKASKPEKKVCPLRPMKTPCLTSMLRPRSTRRWPKSISQLESTCLAIRMES